MAASMRLGCRLPSLPRLSMRLNRCLTSVLVGRVLQRRTFYISRCLHPSQRNSVRDEERKELKKIDWLIKRLQYHEYVDLLFSAKKTKDLFITFLRHFNPRHEGEYNLLLKLTGNRRIELHPHQRTLYTKFVWAMLRKHGLKPSVDNYNSLMTAFIENEYQFSPDEILSEMQKEKLSPNMQTYSLMVDAYCEKGNIEEAGLVLKIMQKSGYRANQDVLLSFVKGYFRSNQIQKAMQIVDVLRKQAVTAKDPQIDILLMKLYLEKGQLDSMKKIRHEAEEAGVLFDSTDFVDLINTLRRFNQLKLLNEVISGTMHWLKSHTEFLQLCSQLELSKHADEKLKIINSLGKSFDNNERELFSLLVKIPIRQNWPCQDLMSFIQSMYPDMENVCPSAAVFAAYELKNVEYALKFLDHLHKEGHVLKAHYFYPAICKYRDTENKDGLEKVLKDVASKARPDPKDQVFAQFLALSVKPGHKNVLSNILDMALSADSPSASSESIFASKLANGHLEEALKMLEDSGSNARIPFRYLKFLFVHYLESKRGDWDSIERLVQYADSGSKLMSLLKIVSFEELYKEAPMTIRKILLKPMKRVLKTYSKETLQQAFLNVQEPEFKHLIRKYWFLQAQSVQEAEGIIPASELSEFDADCFRHKTVLHLKENKMLPAISCFSLIDNKQLPQQQLKQLRLINRLLTDAYTKTVSGIQQTIKQLQFRLVMNKDETEIRHLVQYLCHKSEPKDLITLVKDLSQLSPGSLSFLCRDFLRGYISSGDVTLVKEAYSQVVHLQGRETPGTHYLLEYLISCDNTKDLRKVYNICYNSVGAEAAHSSLYYAYVMNGFPIQDYEKIQWNSTNMSVKSLKMIMRSLSEDLQPREAVDKMEVLTMHYLQNVSLDQSQVLLKEITDCAVTDHEMSKAVNVMKKIKDEKNELWRTRLITNFYWRNTDIGFKIPKVFIGKTQVLWGDT